MLYVSHIISYFLIDTTEKIEFSNSNFTEKEIPFCLWKTSLLWLNTTLRQIYVWTMYILPWLSPQYLPPLFHYCKIQCFWRQRLQCHLEMKSSFLQQMGNYSRYHLYSLLLHLQVFQIKNIFYLWIIVPLLWWINNHIL